MIVLDTETTGLLNPSVLSADHQPQIIDIACVQIDARSGEELKRFQTLIDPGVPLPAEIAKITGYRDSDLRGAPKFAEVLPELVDFFLGENAMLAHNMPFDKGLLYWELMRLDAVTAFPWPPLQLCTVQLFTEEFGRRPKMTQLYEAKLGRKLAQAHTAMADVEALLEIVRATRVYELAQRG